jgi:hypothetical protein
MLDIDLFGIYACWYFFLKHNTYIDAHIYARTPIFMK